MGRLVRAVTRLLAVLRDVGGVSLYETAAVVAMTSIVAAVALPVAIDRIEDAKHARAANETITTPPPRSTYSTSTISWFGSLA